jgi:hypothetical protein
LGVVVGFELGGWDVAELAVESSGAEPVDVAEGGQLDVLVVAPGSLSEWAINPSRGRCRREKIAMFNASVTRSAVIVDEVRQPTIIREYTSVTNAV